MGMTSVKRALVTGGNRGIRYAIAQGLLTKGYEVIITARSLENAKQAADKLTEAPRSDSGKFWRDCKVVSF